MIRLLWNRETVPQTRQCLVNLSSAPKGTFLINCLPPRYGLYGLYIDLDVAL
jgi:hypothetical protein